MLTSPTGQIIHIPLHIQIKHLKKYIQTTYDLNIDFRIKWLNMKLENFYEVTNFKVTDVEQSLKIFEIFNNCIDNIEDEGQNFKDGEIYFKKPNLYVQFYKSEYVAYGFSNECIIPPIHTKDNDAYIKHELFESNNKLILPLYQEDAITLRMTNKNYHTKTNKNVALKIYHNNVNIINNLHYDDDRGITKQNYIYYPRQIWIDGYNNTMQTKLTTSHSVLQCISQFVSKKIKKNITYDDELIDEHIGHELKFEAYTENNKKFKCYNFTQKKFLDVNDVADVGDVLMFYEKKNMNIEETFILTLYDYGIRENDILEMIPVNNVGQIFIKGLTGKTETFLYNDATTIKNLKYMMQKKMGMHILDQRFIHSGIQLDDNKLVVNCVTPHSTIHLTGRLLGSEGREFAKNIGEKNYMSGICHNIWLDNAVRDWNVRTFDSFTINILNEMQFDGKMPVKNNYIHKYPYHAITYDTQILLLKKKIAILKYIMFKTSLKSSLCGDVLEMIFGLLSNLYLFK